MNSIFFGLLLVILDFNIYLEVTTIGILPDFVGYILIIIGFTYLSDINKYFQIGAKVSIACAIISFIHYILAMFGVMMNLSYFAFGFDILLFILLAITLYLLTKAITEIENEYDHYLYGDMLSVVWKANLATYALVIIATFVMNVLAAIALIISVIILLTYMVIFLKSKKVFSKIYR